MIDYNQPNNSNSSGFGPQDGGFDTSGWGNYTNYYPIQNQHNNNNNNNNTTNNHPRGNQRPRSNQQRQQTTNNSVVVCHYPSKMQIFINIYF